MKLTAAFSLILLFSISAAAQLSVEAGYEYRRDYIHLPEIGDHIHTEDVSIHNAVQVEGGYTTKHLWEFSATVSFFEESQGYYQARTTYSYINCCSTHSTGEQLRGNVAFSYTGLRLAAHKWFGKPKVKGLQFGTGFFVQGDFLTNYSESDRYRKTTNYYHASPPGGGETSSYSETDWAPASFTIYEMKKPFFYVGVEPSLRFLLNRFYLQLSVNMGGYTTPRVQEFNKGIYYEEDPYDRLRLSPAFSCKIGYRFQGKKAE